MRSHRYPCSHPASPSAFAGYRFPPEVITLAVRWYLRFGLSYRDVEELLAERGIEVDHVSIYRWVHRFAPEFAEAARARQHLVGDGWHVDETYPKVGGTWRYLFRAIDQFGQVIDVFLSPRRDTGAARRFFERAVGRTGSHPSRSPPTGTASTRECSTSCSLRPSMTPRSMPTTRWRPTTGASKPGFDPCEG
jgi:transposase-like protein